MLNLRRTTATLATTALLATPIVALTAAPASAADREFRVAGAEVEFDVDRDDGRYEVDVEIDDAKPGSKWRVILRHNGKVYFNRVRKADRDGEFEIERKRKNTRGKDVFRITVKKVGGKAKKSRKIVRR